MPLFTAVTKQNCFQRFGWSA